EAVGTGVLGAFDSVLSMASDALAEDGADASARDASRTIRHHSDRIQSTCRVRVRSAFGARRRRAQHRVRALVPDVPDGTDRAQARLQLARVPEVQARGDADV